MDQRQKKQARFSVAYVLIALAARRLVEVETLDRTGIETLVSAPSIAAAKT